MPSISKKQVDIPVHNWGHTLDLIIMEKSEEYQVEKIIHGPHISDHPFITMQLTECKPKVQLLTKHRKIPADIVQEFDKHFNNQPVLKETNMV